MTSGLRHSFTSQDDRARDSGRQRRGMGREGCQPPTSETVTRLEESVGNERSCVFRPNAEVLPDRLQPLAPETPIRLRMEAHEIDAGGRLSSACSSAETARGHLGTIGGELNAWLSYGDGDPEPGMSPKTQCPSPGAGKGLARLMKGGTASSAVRGGCVVSPFLQRSITFSQ